MKEKVLLAFSGGLDTTYCVKYLEEKGMEVHTAIVNTGGFSDSELLVIRAKAEKLGVASHENLDVTDVYYQKCIRYMIFGNMLKNRTYPYSVSSERTFQAIAIVNYARKIGAKYIAHGSTGAGNDQVRFDLIFNVLAPEIKIITPIREKKLSRDEEIEYLKSKGVEANWEKMKYSINKGLWGTSIGGKETLSSNLPLPEEAYPSHPTQSKGETLELEFVSGEVVAVNGEKFENPVHAIRKIEQIGASYAIGRDMHVGDTIIGIKGRVGFEAASAILIINAHLALEKHALTKWQMHWKEQLSTWYGMFLHEGQYLEPVMRNIEKFIEDTQVAVNGKVFIQLEQYRFFINGIESKNDLMNARFASYGEMNNAWTADDVKGFTKILANPLNIYYSVNDKPEIL
jgi:argininosuccinate synthase